MSTESTIRAVVQEVLTQLQKRNGFTAPSKPRNGDFGVFANVDDAVAAANDGYQKLRNATLETRAKAIECVRQICESQAVELGTAEMKETKIGRLDHKIEKLQLLRRVPGMEFMKSEVFSGDHGLAVIEAAPFGVIGAVTPVTHSLPTLACNVINMVSAGNTVVFNPHPSGKFIACEGTRRINRAIYEATGLENLFTIVSEPTLESAAALFAHRGIRLLCVTGGPGVAKAALQATKRAIVAGPGNPPVVVDETADLTIAAKSIIQGGAYDNNLLCIGEKEVFAVHTIFDQLMSEMSRAGAHRLNAAEVDRMTKVAFSPPEKPGDHWHLNRDLIGKDASVLAEQIGVKVAAGTTLLFGETNTENPFVPEEQMMPFVPFIRVRDVHEGIALAKEFEHGFRHTSLIHSRNVRNMTTMGKELDTTLFIKNGPCGAGLGLGGEGYLSFSIAGPTGEGVTTPMTFTRQRRCTLVDDLRIV
ncbi:MAG: aldehyde dehydrogenase EutE [Planctomycetia bacterium]|nr:aldehyde dehydrogenase EutE [Planctomycetia bacterium]